MLTRSAVSRRVRELMSSTIDAILGFDADVVDWCRRKDGKAVRVVVVRDSDDVDDRRCWRGMMIRAAAAARTQHERAARAEQGPDIVG